MRCGVYSNAMKSEMLLGGDLAALQLFDLSRSQVVKEVPHIPMIRAFYQTYSVRPSELIFLAFKRKPLNPDRNRHCGHLYAAVPANLLRWQQWPSVYARSSHLQV
jgi:hypothetical protein